VIGAGATTPRRKEKRRGEERRRMGKVPVRMKAVVYALSPFQQQVMPGLWKDITTKIHHKVSENWISATLLLTPVIGTYQYVTSFLPLSHEPSRRAVLPGSRVACRSDCGSIDYPNSFTRI
jgi:hypothetical protein